MTSVSLLFFPVFLFIIIICSYNQNSILLPPVEDADILSNVQIALAGVDKTRVILWVCPHV